MKQRDIILLPFPFSDQSGIKVRPALILSNNSFNEKSEDILACAITTNTTQAPYTLLIKQEDIEQGILYENSAIKAETILKIDKELIIKKIAILKKNTFAQVIEKIMHLISQE